MSLRDHAGIAVIITLFIFSNAVFLAFYSDVWWDSAVYLGMGKYIYSLGSSGLWEDYRVPLLPSLLGMVWALHLNLVYYARFISLAFAVLVILMTYIMGNEIFPKKVSLMASFFVAFTYTFFFFSSNILTEIPSAFFAMLSFYFFFRKKFFLVGLFAGISVMFRLFHIFVFAGLITAFIAYFRKKKYFFKKLLSIAAGASLPILPYLALNQYLYNDILRPFKVQKFFVATTAWNMYGNVWFYPVALLKENFLIVSLLCLPFFFRKNCKFMALVLSPLMYIIIYSLVRHKEMRFMIVVLPLLYLLASYCLAMLCDKIHSKKSALFLFLLVIFLWLFISFSAVKTATLYQSQRNDEGLRHFQDYIGEVKGNIWITSPLYALYSDKKIEGLLYYYSSGNLINFIDKNIGNVDAVFLNDCDIPCPPLEMDNFCEQSHKYLYMKLSSFQEIYEKEINNCRYRIFKRIT